MNRKGCAGSIGALLALLAVTSSASAAAVQTLPAYYECAKTPGGKYADGKCSKEAAGGKGKYELRQGVGKGKPFKVKITKSVGFEVTGVEQALECKTIASSGKITSPKTETTSGFVFTGCHTEAASCASPGAKAGEVKTAPLEATLGYAETASGPTGTAAWDFQGRARHGVDGIHLRRL